MSYMENKIKGIRERGWYNLNESFSREGIRDLHSFSSEWKTYQLIIAGEEEVDSIRARDDQAALEAFHTLYHLNAPYQIHQVEIKYRLIEQGN